MAGLVLDQRVTLGTSDEDKDRYGRLLRYVDVDGRDAGLEMIESGLAVARYDSRDGYGRHPREDGYIAADDASPNPGCAPAARPVTSPQASADCMTGYSPCLPIVADLDCGEVNGPIRVSGSDPYRLDADGDGVACE
jgi:hypothetical protein